MLNLQNVVKKVRNRMEMVVFLKDEITSETLKTIENTINSFEGIDKIIYVSKEQALERFKEDFKDKTYLLDGTEGNPLPASFEIKLKDNYRTPDRMQSIALRIKTLDGIERVEYGRTLVEKLDRILNVFYWIEGLFLLLIVFTSIFMISNTIRLTVFARKETIEIMKLVGATNWFIRLPYIFEGITQGIIGSGLSLLLLYSFYNLLIFKIRDLVFLYPTFCLGIVASGMVLGVIGSIISVRKFC
jgi:cell division transport system permease protein